MREVYFNKTISTAQHPTLGIFPSETEMGLRQLVTVVRLGSQLNIEVELQVPGAYPQSW
jgi:hypothetical protein